MSELFVGKTANDVWKMAAEKLLDQKKDVNSRCGEAAELLHAVLTVENPTQKWAFDRIPPLSIGYALAEMVWIMNGADDAEVINTWNPKLPDYAGTGKNYYGAYGKRIREHYGFDQLVSAYQALLKNPESRQVVIQIYDTKKDFPIDNGTPRDKDIPCNICSMLKVRDGKLEWSQIMRSSDLMRGLPYDFIQFMSIQEILSGWLDLEVGTYTHYSDSLHLYNKDREKLAIGEEPVIENEDSLRIPFNDSTALFTEMYARMKGLMNHSISEKEIENMGSLNSEYGAYNNIMKMIAAYIANKRKKEEVRDLLVEGCTNNLYVAMWKRWKNRLKQENGNNGNKN